MPGGGVDDGEVVISIAVLVAVRERVCARWEKRRRRNRRRRNQMLI